jgi:invasion protein IalB
MKIGMGKTRALWLLAPLLAMAGLAMAQSKPSAGAGLTGRYGDWKVVCNPPPPGSSHDICALTQSVAAQDRDNIGLTISVEKFSDGKLFLRMLAPLGVLLPPGIGVKIDGEDLGQAPFVRCHKSGCYAQMVVAGALADHLQRGTTAILSIFPNDAAGIGFPISLSGFDQGLAALRAIPLSLNRKGT